MLRTALAAWCIAFAAAAQGGPAPAQQQPALTLERAIQLSLERNYDLRRTEYQMLSAGQDLVIARAAILPKLNVNASLSDTRVGGGQVTGTFTDPVTGAEVTQIARTEVFRGYGATLSASQLLFDGGKWWNNLAAFDLSLASSQASLDEQRLTTVFTVEQRFYELVRQQRQLSVLGEAAKRSRDQAEFVQRLFEGGRATQADVYAARTNRDSDEINRLGQEARVELARQDLAVSIAADPAEPLAIVEPAAMQQDPAAPPPPTEAVQAALAKRPSLKAFALTAESQRKAAAAAKGDYWPTLSLSASYGRQTRSASDFTRSLDEASTLRGSIDLTWNLFNGFATKATVEKAQINTLLAENDLENGRRGVASDVERAVAQLAVARQQVRISVQTLQTASENLRLARTRQQVGVGTQLEVRDAELKLTQAQLARDNALVDGHEAESALRRATGG
ncbi:MAG: TolC family protein [Myxococcales bacterium]